MDLSQPIPQLISMMRDSFDLAKNAFAHDRTPSAQSRRDSLHKLATMLVNNKDASIEAIRADFGNRSAHETELLEIFPALSAIKDARHQLGGWMRPKRSWASMWFLPARTELRPQPLGVIGIIVPWNYPMLLAIAPLVGALSAGNRVMLKMSEFTPRTGQLLADLIGNTFSSDQVSVINGETEVAEAFSQLPFDHLLFTGSTNVGRHVMGAAAASSHRVDFGSSFLHPPVTAAERQRRSATAKILREVIDVHSALEGLSGQAAMRRPMIWRIPQR